MRGCDLDLFLHLDLDKPVSNKQVGCKFDFFLFALSALVHVQMKAV